MRKANIDDAKYLSTRLRDCDVEEIKALTNYSPYTALMMGVINSELPLVIINDDKPVAMFGVVPTEDFALIWLLGTDELKDISLPFLKECREVVKVFNNKHKLLANYERAKRL